MIVSGQALTGAFLTKDDTGAMSAATVGPAGTLYVNGAATADPVASAGANPYSWAVTLPALATGAVVQVHISATVDGVGTEAFVFCDTIGVVPAVAGDEMDFVNAPNATAIAAIQAGLAVPGDIPAMITAQEVRDAGKLAPTAGVPAAGSLDAHLDDIQTDTGNLIARLGAFLGTTTNTVYGWLRAMMRKDVAVPSDIGGTFDPATDSEEGIRDAIPAVVDIVDGVLDEAIAAHLLVGSVGEAINAAGDPWITPLPGAYAAGTAGYIIGNCINETGATQCVYPVTDATTGLPIEGVRVWVSTDAAGAHVIREGYTDAFGNATFWLDPGDYYFWRSHPSYTFAPPADPETVP